MVSKQLHIIMPVKDSIEIAERAIRAIVASGHTVCVYDDNSLQENAERLDQIAKEKSIQVVHISDLTDHPSPNYRLVLQMAQEEALDKGKHLVIVESDVIIQPDTLNRMLAKVEEGVGMVAAVTIDENGEYKQIYRKYNEVYKSKSPDELGKEIEFSSVFPDVEELVEEVSTEDDAPVEVIYRCKKCGQILSADAKDCWKCSSKEIEQVVEEETKELKNTNNTKSILVEELIYEWIEYSFLHSKMQYLCYCLLIYR